MESPQIDNNNFDIIIDSKNEEKSDCFNLPNFFIKEMPYAKVKSLKIKNYKIFDNYEINLMDNNKVNDFVCFIGPNGCGKSTTLEVIQTIFSNYDSYDSIRLNALLGRGVRHVKGDDKSGTYGDSDFSIEAEIKSSVGDYSIELNKSGFVHGHPQQIKELTMRLCYFARFDQELKKFQLSKAKWPIFKELFEAVTGFTIEEEKTVFSLGEQFNNYIFGFYVHKPNETIYHKECSDGERKIIKSFSSLLTLEYSPSIILIDNVEMHVESSRHLPLIMSMKKCFKSSQIFTTTHSYHLSRNFSHKNQIYDLRLLNCSDTIKKEPWRLRVIDEVKDALVRLKSIKKTNDMQKQAISILCQCEREITDINLFKKQVGNFMSKVALCFVNDLI